MNSKGSTQVILSFLTISGLLFIGTYVDLKVHTKYYALSKQLQMINFSLFHLEEVRFNIEQLVRSSLDYASSGSNSHNASFYTSLKSLQSTQKAIDNFNTDTSHNQIDSLSLSLNALEELCLQLVAAREKMNLEQTNSLIASTGHENMKNKVHDLVTRRENRQRSQLRVLESEQQSLAAKAVYVSYLVFVFSFLSLAVVFYLLNKQLARRKAAELRLQKLTRSLQEDVKEKTTEVDQVFNRISDAFIAFNRDWQFTYLNKSAVEFIGKDSAELIGKVVWEVFPESVNTSYYDSCHKAIESQKYVYHEAYYEPWDIYVENRIYPSEDGLSIFFKDVTEQKKAEQEEIKLKRQLEAIFENTSDIILLTNDRAEYIQCNEAACKHLGYSKEEILNLKVNELALEASPDESVDDLWNTFKQNGALKGLIKLKKKDGGLIDCQYSAKANVLPGIHLSILTDVTKLIETNKELEESQRRYQNAEKIGKLGHWELNLRNDTLLWSDEIYRLFSISTDISPSYDLFFSFIHPEDKDTFQEQQEMALTGKQALDIVHRIIRKDGEVRYMHEKANLIKNKHGMPIKLRGVVQDITERKIVEEQTIESKRRLEAIFNGTNDAILVANDAGEYVQVNPAACRMLGYTQEEMLEKHVMDMMTGDDKQGAWEEFKKGNYQTGEIELLRKDKQLIICNYSATANILPGLHLSIFTDVTEKHRSEQELKHSYRQLQELTGRLQIVREEERIHIAREIHDELGQKLTGIKIDTARLGKKMEGNDDAKRKINEVTILVDEAIDTVRRISSELRPGLLEHFGLIAACESQSAEFQQRHQIKSKFVSELSEVDLKINDSLTVYRIYQEALTNIARHAQATEVETLIKKIDNYLVLTIKDNGLGFDLDAIKTKRSLGLVGMRERAHLAKGELFIESHENRGTKITLKIPLDLQTT